MQLLFDVYTMTLAQADAASTNVLGVIHWLEHYDLPDSQTPVQISELVALFRYNCADEQHA